MKPNVVNIRKWVRALRTTKKRQATGFLHTNDGFCCLGIACEVALRNGVKIKVERDSDSSDDDFCVSYGGNSSLLPPKVRAFFGFKEMDPTIAFDEGGSVTASTANDDKKWNFRKIADAVETMYLKKKKEKK